jgi:Phospholipase_D-nuclease N-terminal
VTFWEFVWIIFITYLFIAYLMVVFAVITDIFRDRSTGGFAKAVWIVALILLPFITLMIYLIANGREMAERHAERAMAVQARQEAYIREVAAPAAPVATPTEQVVQAKALLDAGAISPAEFESMKASALAGTRA